MRLLIVLIVVAMSSALGVVYAKYRARMLFNEAHKLEQGLIAYDEELARLHLQQNTLAEHSRVEKVARGRLGMVLPPRESVRRITP